MAEIIRFRMLMIAAGYQDGNDADSLRHDPMFKLAMTLNNLLASPSFAAWLEGEPLDIKNLLYTANGKPKISIISIAHLNDAMALTTNAAQQRLIQQKRDRLIVAVRSKSVTLHMPEAPASE